MKDGTIALVIAVLKPIVAATSPITRPWLLRNQLFTSVTATIEVEVIMNVPMTIAPK